MMQRKASRDSRSLWTGSKSVGTLKDAKESRCHIAGVQEVGGYEGGVDCEEDSYYEVNSHKSSAKQEGKRHVQDLYVNIPVHTTNNYGGNPAKNFEVESYKEDKEGEEEDDKAQHGASSQVQMRPDLAEISFEDLQKLRERVGIRRYERMAFKQLRNTGKKKIPKRINKNRPVEISAKQPVGVLRQVASVKKQESRDPRFSDMHGTFIPEIFHNNYAFLNDIKTYEKEVLQKELAKTKCPEKKTKMVEILQRMVDQEREQERQRQQEQRVQQAKELALKQLREGKTPHFYKRSELRNMEMAEKFESLQKLGKLDKFMKKRRQKNMQRARRLLPQNND